MEQAPRLARHFIYYIATIVFFSIGAITTTNLNWYRTLDVPAWMLPNIAIALIWGVLVLLTAQSLTTFWETRERDAQPRTTLLLYAANAFLILVWNFTFFGLHNLPASFVIAIAVMVNLISIMVRVQRIARRSATLLLPYLVWMIYALYLSYHLMQLN